MTYRPHLDGIRAIAVLAVVLFHAHAPGVPGGFVGVDVFFVISGYLIIGLLLLELEETGDISVRRFVERRIRRLAPALFVVLLATLIAGMVWMSPIRGEQQGLATSAIATVLLSANHYFLAHTGGYFDAPNESFPLLHTWTLSVEEQFYLVWPWLLLAVGAWSRFRGTAATRAASILLATVFALSLAACVWATRNHQHVAFFLMPFRAWEFAAGGAVVLLLRWRRPTDHNSEAIAAIGLFAVVASVMTIGNDASFPGWIATMPVLGSAALIYGSEANPNGVIARLLSLKPMVWFGLISYSLYLWHWPLLSVASIALVDEMELGKRILLCLIAVVLAWATYRYVEKPIRSRRAALMATQPRTYRVGAGMMVCLIVVALGLGGWAKFVWPRFPGNAEKAARIAAIENWHRDCKPDSESKPDSNGRRGCLVGHGGPVKILLWGDSHAGQLKPVLDALVAARGGSGLLRYDTLCPPILEYSPRREGGGDRKCPAFNRDVLADIHARPEIDMVILNAFWVAYFRQEDQLPSLTAALKRTIASLRTARVRVVLVAPDAEFPHRVPECLIRRDESSCELSRSDALRQRTAAMSVIASIASAYPDVVVIDPLATLCPNSRCPVRSGEDVLYSDGNHLSTAGAKKLIPAFLTAQKAILATKGPDRMRQPSDGS